MSRMVVVRNKTDCGNTYLYILVILSASVRISVMLFASASKGAREHAGANNAIYPSYTTIHFQFSGHACRQNINIILYARI